MCCTVMYLLRFIEDIAVFLWISGDFADLCEFHSSATVQNINAPKLSVTKAVNITKIFTSMTSTLVKSGKCALYMYMPVKASPAWRKSKSVCVNSLAVKSASIKCSTLATKGKSRLNLFSFSPVEKIKEPKFTPYFAAVRTSQLETRG